MRRLTWLVPTLYIVFLMLPIYWLLNMSFKTTNEILGTFSLWPREFTLENYAKIVTDPVWYKGYLNSIVYATLNTVISVSAALPRKMFDRWLMTSPLTDQSLGAALTLPATSHTRQCSSPGGSR